MKGLLCVRHETKHYNPLHVPLLHFGASFSFKRCECFLKIPSKYLDMSLDCFSLYPLSKHLKGSRAFATERVWSQRQAVISSQKTIDKKKKKKGFFIVIDACNFCFIFAVLFNFHHFFSSSKDTERWLPQ